MKLWDWVVWNQRLKWKIIEHFMPSEHFIFFLCVYRVVVEITKETWGKCGIKTVKHYNEKKELNRGKKWATLKYNLGIQILLTLP